MKTTQDTVQNVSRRKFMITSAAAGGGLMLGMNVPFAGEALAQSGNVEMNAWVVIKPDDTVVIRIARAEMAKARSPVLPSSWPKNSSATGRKSPPSASLRDRTSRPRRRGAT